MYDLVERRMYNVQGIILENECAIEALKVGQWGRENKTEGKREREKERENISYSTVVLLSSYGWNGAEQVVFKFNWQKVGIKHHLWCSYVYGFNVLLIKVLIG